MNKNNEFVEAELKKWAGHYGKMYWSSSLDVVTATKDQYSMANRYINHRIRDKQLTRIHDKQCIDCGVQAQQHHHYLSYKECDYGKVVPMCTRCHNAIHSKLKTDIYFEKNKVFSFKKHIKNNPIISVEELGALHGMSNKNVREFIRSYDIDDVFKNRIKGGVEKNTPKPTRSMLIEHMDDGLTKVDIGKLYDVSRQTIGIWCNEHDIPLVKRTRPTVEEIQVYNELSNRELSEVYGVDPSRISRWRKYYDIRPPKRTKSTPSIARDILAKYRQDGLSYQSIGEIVGRSAMTIRSYCLYYNIVKP